MGSSARLVGAAREQKQLAAESLHRRLKVYVQG